MYEVEVSLTIFWNFKNSPTNKEKVSMYETEEKQAL